MKAPYLAIATLASALAGCNLTLPVSGASESGDETFTGTATGGVDGSGSLQIVTSRGVRCTGDFIYITRRDGRGTFRCANGQGGAFEFVSTGDKGMGSGSIGGRRFTFQFG